MLAPPRHDFGEELIRLKPSLRFDYPVKSSVDPDVRTAEADLEDLTAALKTSGLSRDRTKRLLKTYSSLRERMRVRKEVSPDPLARIVPDAGLLEALPGEFSDYLKGALLWRTGRREEARTHWLALLNRPASHRYWRTTWATYMVARSYLETEPDVAITYYRRVRKQVDAGFRDSLGLAAESVGWEARAELDRRQFIRAIELYLAQYGMGDGTARSSLRTAALALIHGGVTNPALLREAARNADARAVITAYLSAARDYSVCDLDGTGLAQVRAWLDAVEAEGVQGLVAADRMAWAAYRTGAMDDAARWLARADDDSPIAVWIRAKLLLRQGKTEEAGRLILAVFSVLTKGEPSKRFSQPDYEMAWGRLDWSDQAAGELAFLRLSSRDYIEALELFLFNDWLWDAAYVAERVLTLPELIEYVDGNWPEEMARYGEDESKDKYLSGQGNRFAAGWIRYLLARRLVRAGRWKEARSYYPPTLRPVLDRYIASIRRGHDSKLGKLDRGRAFWRAAVIARRQGMELLGTELEPDWRILEGNYAPHGITEQRAWAKNLKFAPATEDELNRVAASVTKPDKRFHYRYEATNHAWSAAQLMPDDTDEKARVLCEAGRWIAKRDPEEADRFYKALVRTCGGKRRWARPRIKSAGFPIPTRIGKCRGRYMMPCGITPVRDRPADSSCRGRRRIVTDSSRDAESSRARSRQPKKHVSQEVMSRDPRWADSRWT